MLKFLAASLATIGLLAIPASANARDHHRGSWGHDGHSSHDGRWSHDGGHHRYGYGYGYGDRYRSHSRIGIGIGIGFPSYGYSAGYGYPAYGYGYGYGGEYGGGYYVEERKGILSSFKKIFRR